MINDTECVLFIIWKNMEETKPFLNRTKLSLLLERCKLLLEMRHVPCSRTFYTLNATQILTTILGHLRKATCKWHLTLCFVIVSKMLRVAVTKTTPNTRHCPILSALLDIQLKLAFVISVCYIYIYLREQLQPIGLVTLFILNVSPSSMFLV